MALGFTVTEDTREPIFIYSRSSLIAIVSYLLSGKVHNIVYIKKLNTSFTLQV
uniref:Uncharacterized protein n=1 Tax=Candidatus Methanogaster sp. ANME-2c ERB4 TaxID=2759911 RepID=A0A7G9Y7T8_9EURY|nr:hypothetical protein NKAHAHGG_00001 [Methanosarcinales archaeon ANME-2c ERB4]QNO44889.1 hypothetical protein GGFKAAOC_00001 [Methanosarcinales archaeon ANME-2c ERB4]